MRLQIVSDLHLEFEKPEVLGGEGFKLTNDKDADVLILAGDVQAGDSMWAWFSDLLKHYPHVMYIPGNHEFYRQNYYELMYEGGFINFVDRVNEEATSQKYDGKLHWLNNEIFTLNDVVFMGHILWTDMNNNDPMTKYTVQGGMNDFRLIKWVKDGVYSRFTVDTAYAENQQAQKFLDNALSDFNEFKKVVVTHHGPTRAVVHPRFADEYQMNGGYTSELPDLIEKADLWVHGHVHNSFDEEVYGTRIVVNPRGYVRHDENPNFDPNKIVEI